MFNLFNRMTVVLACLLFVATTYAHTNVVVIPLGDDAPKPIEYAIGDTGPAGGIVFHVTDGGLHGLEAALEDQSLAAPWNCLDVNVLGVVNLENATDEDPKSGAINSSFIAAQCPGADVSAAVLAAVYIWPNGQTDGFLPNKEELALLYAKKDIVGNFISINNTYSSSSEHNVNGAWVMTFIDGNQFPNFKSNQYGVRSIRAF